jgi:septal ring factor EnvC (AmiA/AmiB activator)
VLFAALAVAGLSGPAALAAPTATVLAQASEATPEDLPRLLSRERSLLAQLEFAEGESQAAETALGAAVEAWQQTEAELADRLRRSDSFTRDEALRRERLRARLRALYKLSRGGFVRLLVESPNRTDLFARRNAARRILRRDLEEIALQRRELSLLAEERRTLEKRRAEAALLRTTMEKRRAESDEAARRARALLFAVRRDRRLIQRLGGELDAEMAALVRRLEAREAYLRPQGAFLSLRGRLPRPVTGPVVGRFGPYEDPETGVELSRNGVEIAGADGAVVRAAAAATVRFAGEARGYGRVAILDPGDGVLIIYGHLRALSVVAGERVLAGQPLGELGRGPQDRRAHLYLEVRQRGQPVDPASWFRLRGR